MSSLPEDINRDILLRLPVKSLLACKCVCRAWFSIISDSDFIETHLKGTIKTKNRSLLLESKGGNSFYSVSYDSLSSWNDSDNDVALEIDFPLKSLEDIELLGSCNGLVYGWNDQLELFFLWNPATKQYKRLPKSQARFHGYGTCHGLGYDYQTDDYKLVHIDGNRKSSLVHMYSLKSNSWVSVQSILYGFHESEMMSGVLFNGALHWLVPKCNESSNVILSMDISEERFEELQLPSTDYDFKNIEVLKGCLCVLTNRLESFEVWVMQDYGVQESWIKLHTITIEDAKFNPCYFVKLIGSLTDGRILFKDPIKDNLIVYDPEYEDARKIHIRGLNTGLAVNYFDSLVSLKSTTVVGRKKKRVITTRILKESKSTKKRRS